MLASPNVEIELSVQPDGLGMLYGSARWQGQSVMLDVMPPEPLWRGDVRMPECPPDPTRWKVFADGELVGRVEATWPNLIERLETLLLHGDTSC